MEFDAIFLNKRLSVCIHSNAAPERIKKVVILLKYSQHHVARHSVEV